MPLVYINEIRSSKSWYSTHTKELNFLIMQWMSTVQLSYNFPSPLPKKVALKWTFFAPSQNVQIVKILFNFKSIFSVQYIYFKIWLKDVRDDSSEFCRIHSCYWSSHKKKLSAAPWFTCVYNPPMDLPDNTKMISHLAPMELHLMSGNFNRLNDAIEERLTELACPNGTSFDEW